MPGRILFSCPYRHCEKEEKAGARPPLLAGRPELLEPMSFGLAHRKTIDDRGGVRFPGGADALRPVLMVYAVGVELGLKGKAGARDVRRAVLHAYGIVEPVAGIEVRPRRCDQDVERATACRVRRPQCVTRAVTLAVPSHAEAVVVAVRPVELHVILGNVSSERLWLEEVKGRARNGENLPSETESSRTGRK